MNEVIHSRGFRVMFALVCVNAVIGMIALGVALYAAAVQSGNIEDTVTANCERANDTRDIQRGIYDQLITIYVGVAGQSTPAVQAAAKALLPQLRAEKAEILERVNCP